MKRRSPIVLTIVVGMAFLLVGFTSSVQAGAKWYPFEVEAIYKWGDTVIEDFSPPEKANRPYRLGISLPLIKNPYWVNIAYGVWSEAKSLGCETTILAAASYDDLPTQISQIENLVQRGIDALLLGPISFEGTARVVEETIDKGIPVFMLAQTTKSVRVSGIALANDYKLGYDLGQWVIRDSGGNANLVLLSGPSGITWTSLLSKGLHAAVRGYSGIKILDERWTDIDVAVGQNTAENLLQAYPDLNYITAVDVLGHGAANALIAARKTDTVKLGMVYASEESLPYIRNGSVDIGFSEPTVILARIVVDLAVKHLNGEQNVPYIIHPASVGITKANIDKLDKTNFYAPSGWRVPITTGK
ncbi:MAG: substrate-binding domain-containing protein [Deltaproteobacteria bacterium]|nr:substrate-binding domain-containing protein [Deltaproteobacteria bacterium]